MIKDPDGDANGNIADALKLQTPACEILREKIPGHAECHVYRRYELTACFSSTVPTAPADGPDD